MKILAACRERGVVRKVLRRVRRSSGDREDVGVGVEVEFGVEAVEMCD